MEEGHPLLAAQEEQKIIYSAVYFNLLHVGMLKTHTESHEHKLICEQVQWETLW